MATLEFQCEHQYPGGFRLALEFSLRERFTALFGPSGCGKTSILSVIAGFLRPKAGRVVLKGRVLLETSKRISLRPEQRHVGFVFQDALLFPHLSVERNLRYGHHRRSRRVVDFQRVVEVLEIGHLLKRKPRNLSGGERQRVALGRALLSGPELLLMDEPLAALDAPLKMRILDLSPARGGRVERAHAVRHPRTEHGPAGRRVGAGPARRTVDRHRPT